MKIVIQTKFLNFFGPTILTREKRRKKTNDVIQHSVTKKLHRTSYTFEGREYQIMRSKEEGNKPSLKPGYRLIRPSIININQLPLYTNSEYLVCFTNKQILIRIAFRGAILIMKLRWDFFLFMMLLCLNHILALVLNVFSFQTKKIWSYHRMVCVTNKQVQIELRCKHYKHA